MPSSSIDLLQRDAPALRRDAPAAVVEVAAHVQVREQRRLLDHVAQLAPVRGHEAARGIVLPDQAVQRDAAGRRHQPGQRAQHRGLAAARRAEQRADAARRQRQFDIEHEAVARQAQAGVDHRSASRPAWRGRFSAYSVTSTSQREDHHAGGQAVRGGELHRLDMVVDRHRQHARLARDVAADHQHHAELADGVREAQHRGGHQPGPRQRQRDAEEAVPAAPRAAWPRLPACARGWPRRPAAAAARRRAANRSPRPPPARQR